MEKCSSSFPLVRLDALGGGWRRSEIRELWLRTTGRWRPTFGSPVSPFRGDEAVEDACRTCGAEETGDAVDILNVPSEICGNECFADVVFKNESDLIEEPNTFKSTQRDGEGVLCWADCPAGIEFKWDSSSISSDCFHLTSQYRRRFSQKIFRYERLSPIDRPKFRVFLLIEKQSFTWHKKW